MVGFFGDDVVRDQPGFAAVRAVGNDPVSIVDTGQLFQRCFAGRVDIHQLHFGVTFGLEETRSGDQFAGRRRGFGSGLRGSDDRVSGSYGFRPKTSGSLAASALEGCPTITRDLML
jgi:hypothetical protein